MFQGDAALRVNVFHVENQEIELLHRNLCNIPQFFSIFFSRICREPQFDHTHSSHEPLDTILTFFRAIFPFQFVSMEIVYILLARFLYIYFLITR